jgi:hypothetical protein
MTDSKHDTPGTAEQVIANAIEFSVCSDGNSDARLVARSVLDALDRAGFVLALKVSAGELSPWQKAEAAIDRHRAMKGRLGYERHPDFGKGLVP